MSYAGNLPTPDQVRTYFMDKFKVNYDDPVEEVNFSGGYERVILVLKEFQSMHNAITLYKYLKQNRLTNLHMTYVDKRQKICIYFDLDSRVGKIVEPENPVAKWLKENF